MGKKDKRDNATPTKETFGPLPVEVKSPATAVLLLSSPEEDILIKACEAVHAFADKGDENKVFILGLGALEPLCQLINHSNELIRRKAFMTLGIMSTHAEVKNALKKLNVIPSIIDKLSPQEGTVIHEYGTLCLASLSADFVSKAQIFDNNGLPPLIQLLSSPDPDVVKNSLEIIFNQVQDYPSREAMYQLGAVPHLLAQLKSEYPVIQQLALKILQNITIDKDTRSTFREEHGFEELINVLKNEDLHDLHAGSLEVIANCLNDSEFFHLIHKGGGLAQLMEFILSPTQPEIQANAVKCIAKVAQSTSENRNMLHEQNVEKLLVELFSVNDDRVKTAASQAVSAMCANLASKHIFRELDCIPALVQLLSSESVTVKREASRALADLTHDNQLNIRAVYEAGGHEQLVQLLKEECPVTVASCAATLSNMAFQEDIRYSILSQNALPALVEPLKSTDSNVQTSSALCVAVLACDTASRTEFKNAGGLPPLVHLLDSKRKDVQKMTCIAVKACASDEHCAVEMCVLGALEKLQNINQSETQKTVFSETAMTALLNFNLPVKYSLTGSLSPSDHITDGFYDAGKTVAGRRVLSLAEHYSQPVDQRRAIIVINTANQRAEETTVSSEQKQQHLSGAGISAKRERPRKKKEEDKLKDKEPHQSVPQSPTEDCKMLNDPALQDLVQEAKETVLQLEDEMEQYSALARMVNQAMGGEVDMDKMHEFEWPLHIGQIKFQLKSNVVPIGMINKGTYYHRALLFKCLADCTGLSCSLVRGEYNRAWNEVLVLKGQAQRYIVDLMHTPGRLLKVNTPAAEKYRSI